jgi:hypothetical protein
VTTPGGNRFNLRMVRFPLTVLGAVVLLDDGSYDVFLNSCMTVEIQQKALEHEMRHIDKDHFYNDVLTVAALEAEARGEPARPEPEPEPQTQQPGHVPDVFCGECPEGTIPIFNSLDIFENYLVTLARKKRRELAGKEERK